MALPVVLDAVVDELSKLERDGVTDVELSRAKVKVEAATADALDGLSPTASRLSIYEAFLGEPDSFERDLARYRAATSDGIVDAARRTLRRGRVVMSVVPPGNRALAVINPMPARSAP